VVDHRAARQRHLLRYLRAAAALAFACAAAGAALPGDAGRLAGGAAVIALVSAPLVRVLWLALRWLRRGDRGFALAALTVLAVVASGALLA
jgi:hypothetical protein